MAGKTNNGIIPVHTAPTKVTSLRSRSNKRHFVVKANGKRVPFDHAKVEGTCIRAGASKKLASKIAKNILNQIDDGTSTKEIYRMVLNALASVENGEVIKHRYRLKESIMLMGPAGFRFENYVARILQDCNYQIDSLRTEFEGKCVKHEIDIAVTSKSTRKKYMVECKHHNMPGIFTGIKDSLYTHARFLDLENHFNSEILVTNTKISEELIEYSKCVEQNVLSWKYPPTNSLEKIIEKEGLYPLTILPLSQRELAAFSENRIIIAKDLLSNNVEQQVHKIGINAGRIGRLRALVRQILD